MKLLKWRCPDHYLYWNTVFLIMPKLMCSHLNRVNYSLYWYLVSCRKTIIYKTFSTELISTKLSLAANKSNRQVFFSGDDRIYGLPFKELHSPSVDVRRLQIECLTRRDSPEIPHKLSQGILKPSHVTSHESTLFVTALSTFCRWINMRPFESIHPSVRRSFFFLRYRVKVNFPLPEVFFAFSDSKHFEWFTALSHSKEQVSWTCCASR